MGTVSDKRYGPRYLVTETYKDGRILREKFKDKDSAYAWAEWVRTEHAGEFISVTIHNVGTDYEPPQKDGLAPYGPLGPKKAGADLDGVMICLKPEKEAAEKLTIESGEPVENIHLTLFYFGTVGDDYDDEWTDTIKDVAELMAAQTTPFKGKTQGRGVFNTDDSQVLWASPDVQGLTDFRALLATLFDGAGVEYKKDHDFVPHITLKYYDTGDGVDMDGPDVDLNFDGLYVTVGGTESYYPFKGKEGKTAAWEDVRKKAKQIADSGGVSILRHDDEIIAASVQSTTGKTYTSILYRQDPTSRSIDRWECECNWNTYSWGRSGPWKKYEGRMCAHATATLYEAQSNEVPGWKDMDGREFEGAKTEEVGPNAFGKRENVGRRFTVKHINDLYTIVGELVEPQILVTDKIKIRGVKYEKGKEKGSPKKIHLINPSEISTKIKKHTSKTAGGWKQNIFEEWADSGMGYRYDNEGNPINEWDKKYRRGKTAMPSWRALQGSDFWNQYDAVILPDIGSRRPSFEVYTYGHPFGHYPTLEAAKSAMEAVYGNLPWQKMALPEQIVDHPTLGPTSEFTDPKHCYVVLSLPRLAGTIDRLGRCYELAGRYVMDNAGTQLVHGSIQGMGNPRIDHAWAVTSDGQIYDAVLDEEFDPVAHLHFFSAEEHIVYERFEAMALMAKHKHWGPWDNRTAKTADNFEEHEHPRNSDGKFRDKNGPVKDSPRKPKPPKPQQIRQPNPKQRTSPRGFKEVTREVVQKAKKVEPRVTGLMEQQAKATGATLKGLEYRFKGEESLERKLKDRANRHKLDAEKASKKITDSLRYTMAFNPDNMADGIQGVLENMKAEGFEPAPNEFENYFAHPDDDYQGFHVIMEDEEGFKFELQFHTEESFKVKMENHEDYEVFRSSNNKEERKKLWYQMVNRARTITPPKGIENLGIPKKHEFAASSASYTYYELDEDGDGEPIIFRKVVTFDDVRFEYLDGDKWVMDNSLASHVILGEPGAKKIED